MSGNRSATDDSHSHLEYRSDVYKERARSADPKWESFLFENAMKRISMTYGENKTRSHLHADHIALRGSQRPLSGMQITLNSTAKVHRRYGRE